MLLRSFVIDQDSLARLLVRLVPVGDRPWRPTTDRTNWQFRKAEHQLPGARHRPAVDWSVLEGPCNSDTAERIAMMERFLHVFGVDQIAALLADREFVGEDGFLWLQRQGIPSHQHPKRNTLA
ncbi:uncharacterized protein sS8_4065 [Methylocaldum marinum]|uniref:Transposase n=1 Tax=Methylocaldum marinum TaxID=1432792 RepID=A0A250KWJ2_9GAMM|nr:hypothetical protein [Methylocaldum marinum]BBA35995.1 uncharacterized protein sS8_4065 [Methylocaldum marinum]